MKQTDHSAAEMQTTSPSSFDGTAVSASAEATVPRKESAKKANTGWHEPGYWERQVKGLKKYRNVLWFLLPAAMFTLIFSYLPMFGVLFSFKGSTFNLMRYSVIENLFLDDWTFQNYLDIFVDERFLRGIGNSLFTNIIRLVICFPLSILLAIQLSELKNQTLSKLILILLCIPNFLSWVIVIGVWAGLLDSSGGALNNILVAIGFNVPNNFLMGQDNLFKFFVVFLSWWKNTGWGCIMYYAAISAIDKTYYESATLEGANRIQKAWYLTLPSILPTVALMLVLNFSGMLSVGFEQVYTMMQLNPVFGDTQLTLDTYIFEISVISRSNMPFATALGVFNGLIALALMLIGNAITSKTLKRGLW